MPRRKRQEAPVQPKATRRVSDSTLMRLLDPHMQESLSDIGDIYQKAASRMGAKSMQWKEYLKVSHSVNSNEQVLDIISLISQWRLSCTKREVDSRPVMLLVTDSMSIASIVRALRMRTRDVVQHIRASLGLWSLYRKRCNAATVNILLSQMCAVPLRAGRPQNK